jgi:hypothetical protein
MATPAVLSQFVVGKKRIIYEPRAFLTVAIGPYWESPAYSYLAEFKTSGKPFTRQRTIVVDPGDWGQLRKVRCIRQHFRKRHSARKPCEENLIHSAVQSAVDWGDRHVVFKQLRIFALVGALFLQRPPRDFRIHDKGGTFTSGIEHKRIRRIRGRLRVEYIAAITHIHLGFEKLVAPSLRATKKGALRPAVCVR